MALDSAIAAVIYAGNASTSTPYPVPFRYLDAADVYVMVTAQGAGTVTVTDGAAVFSSAQPAVVIDSKIRIGGTVYQIATRASDTAFTFKTRPTISASTFHHVEAAVTLTGSDYTLASDGVRTAVAVAITALVTIYRRTPAIQPTVLPVAGALPAATLETMGDRETMLIQELISRFDGTGVGLPGSSAGNLLEDTAVFADATARGAAVPKRAGQIGIQILPSPFTIWRSTGTGAGAWEQYEPGESASAETDRLTLGFVGDCGLQGSNQTALAAALAAGGLDGVVFCGDNSYGGESEFEDDWAAFAAWVNAETAYPVLGNHDIDGASTWGLHYNKFAYLPGNRRYRNLVLGDGLVEMFVLHSGRNTAWALAEPDGNTVGSAQHTWFVATLNASTARWKLAFFHHPPVSTESDANTVEPNLDWPEFARVDGVFCGHTHLTEWLTLRGVPVVNVSGAVKTDGDCSLVPQGALASRSTLVWANDRRRLWARLNITPRDLVVELIDVANGRLVYQRSLGDRTLSESEWGQEVVAPNVPVSVGWYFVGMAPAGFVAKDWFIACAGAGSAILEGVIWVDGVQAVWWEIPAGDYWAIVTPEDKFEVRPGAFVQAEVISASSYPAWTGLQVNLRGRIVT